jgi:predicted DNA-binding transcriptional regulator AlpA
MLTLKKDTTLVNVDEAAEIYGCSRARIYQLVAVERLKPLISYSRMKLFDRAEVEKLRDEALPKRREFEARIIERARKRGDIKRAAWAVA